MILKLPFPRRRKYLFLHSGRTTDLVLSLVQIFQFGRDVIRSKSDNGSSSYTAECVGGTAVVDSNFSEKTVAVAVSGRGWLSDTLT